MLGNIPGRGMCMPGKGTLNGGTMTGGNAGIAAAGWATAWGRPGGRLRGSNGSVCPAVTVAVTVGTLTTATGVTPTLTGGVDTTGGISDTVGVAMGWETVGEGLLVRSGLAASVWVGEACWVETGVTVVTVLDVVEAGLLDADPVVPAWTFTIDVSSDC